MSLIWSYKEFKLTGQPAGLIIDPSNRDWVLVIGQEARDIEAAYKKPHIEGPDAVLERRWALGPIHPHRSR